MGIPNVSFAWTAPSPADPNLSYYIVKIVETNTTSSQLPAGATSAVLPAPNNGSVATPGTYHATLTAYNSAGVPDPAPPTITFTINPPAPPPAPLDPKGFVVTGIA